MFCVLEASKRRALMATATAFGLPGLLGAPAAWKSQPRHSNVAVALSPPDGVIANLKQRARSNTEAGQGMSAGSQGSRAPIQGPAAGWS